MVILAYPDPNKDYRIYTDASDQSIGTCLSQMVYDKKIWERGRKTNLLTVP